MFDKDAFSIFLEPITWDLDSYAFNRDEKDMRPYSVQDKKDQTIIVHNILGIEKQDLKVTRELKNNTVFLLIEGKTKDNITGKDYSIKSQLQLDDSYLDVSKISCDMKNGLLYITIPKKEKQSIDKTVSIKIN